MSNRDKLLEAAKAFHEAEIAFATYWRTLLPTDTIKKHSRDA